MTLRLKNKVAIITGAGSRGEITGIGQATAILMAKEGAKILLNDINIENSTLIINYTKWKIYLAKKF